MTGPAQRSWTEAMLADLQRQIDDLTDQVQVLTHLVHLLRPTSAASYPCPPAQALEEHDG